MRFFCPSTSYYESKSLRQCYKDNELLKKRKYEQRIKETEHGCFSPSIFSTTERGFDPVSVLLILTISSANHKSKTLKSLI